MTIGQQLLTPDIGWKRLDSSDNAFKFYGSSWVIDNNAGIEYVNNSLKACNAYGDKVTILFSGTKFRLIGNLWSNASPSINISIDGVSKGSISQYGTSQLYRVISYEILDLPNTPHIIELSQGNSGGYFYLDAIDVDVDSVVINSFEYITKTSVSQMNTGDRISCEYTALSNSHGTYANLGKATKPEIPLNGSAIPDGTFYFRMVGYDLQGRKKLIPDRNIQHSISWDTLNTAGVVSGSGLPITIDGKDGYGLRLMSGGTSATDKDNEWDKIIVESTLNGNIVAGDNAVWNINSTPSSFTSTRSTSGGVVGRGYSNTSAWYSVNSNVLDSTNGFRPVLLVESQNIFTLILKDNKAYSCTGGSVTEVASDWNSLTNVQKQALFTSAELPPVSFFSTFGICDILTASLLPVNAKLSVNEIPLKTDLPTSYTPTVTACPKPQFVYAIGDIDLSGSQNIDWIHINNGISNSVTGNSKLKYVFSVDKGVTWKTYKAGAFIDILNTANVADGSVVGGRFIPSTDAITRLLADGLDKANFDSAPWNETTIALGNELIRFAAIFDLDKTTDNCYNDNLTYQYDGNSVWKQAINGVDYEARFTSPRKLEIKFLTGGYKAKVNY